MGKTTVADSPRFPYTQPLSYVNEENAKKTLVTLLQSNRQNDEKHGGGKNLISVLLLPNK